MAVEGPDGRRLPCPCCARRAEQHLTAAHRRLLSALAVAGLAALAVLGVSSAPARAQPAASSVSMPQGQAGGLAADRIMLIAIAVIAVGAFAVLLVVARSQRRRWSAFADWRTWPPGYDPWADGGDPVAGQHEGSAYRPGYGFLPGPGRGRLPRGAARLRYLCPDVASVLGESSRDAKNPPPTSPSTFSARRSITLPVCGKARRDIRLARTD